MRWLSAATHVAVQEHRGAVIGRGVEVDRHRAVHVGRAQQRVRRVLDEAAEDRELGEQILQPLIRVGCQLQREV